MHGYILSAGYGSRMAELTKTYKCKSLIPICSEPSFFWTINAMDKVGLEGIFLNSREELIAPFDEFLATHKFKTPIHYFRDEKNEGSMSRLATLYKELNDDILIAFGNNPMPAAHLKKLIDMHERGALTISLFKTTSETASKIGVLGDDSAVEYIRFGPTDALADGELYIEPPYIYPREFIALLEPRKEDSFKYMTQWMGAGKLVRGTIANFPHEFHYAYELPALEEYIKANLLEKNSDHV